MSRITFETIVIAEVWDGDRLVQSVKTDNFLTETGEALVADRLSDLDDAGGAFSHMGIGTGTGQTRTSTTLATPVGTRQAFDGGYPDQGTGADDNDVIMRATFAAGNPATDANISEGAVFNESAGGTMVNYFTFNPPLAKLSTQSLVLIVYITCGYS